MKIHHEVVIGLVGRPGSTSCILFGIVQRHRFRRILISSIYRMSALDLEKKIDMLLDELGAQYAKALYDTLHSAPDHNALDDYEQLISKLQHLRHKAITGVQPLGTLYADAASLGVVAAFSEATGSAKKKAPSTAKKESDMKSRSAKASKASKASDATSTKSTSTKSTGTKSTGTAGTGSAGTDGYSKPKTVPPKPKPTKPTTPEPYVLKKLKQLGLAVDEDGADIELPIAYVPSDDEDLTLVEIILLAEFVNNQVAPEPVTGLNSKWNEIQEKIASFEITEDPSNPSQTGYLQNFQRIVLNYKPKLTDLELRKAIRTIQKGLKWL